MGFTRRQWVALTLTFAVGVVGVIVTSNAFPGILN